MDNMMRIVWSFALCLCIAATAIAVEVVAPKENERAEVLRRSEAALAHGDTDAAIDGFERAGLMLHAADAETGLVRSYLQAGQYRRALAFAAHVAGEHPDDASGIALYAWLLHVGGQTEAAKRLVSNSQIQMPEEKVFHELDGYLRNDRVAFESDLPQAGTRLAPYDLSEKFMRRAKVIATGMVIDEGRRALVPLSAVSGIDTVTVRNGIGQSTEATVEWRLRTDNLAVLRLRKALQFSPVMMVAPRNAFPGSIGYAIGYTPSRSAAPAWPLLSAGFLGSPLETGQLHLGIEMPAGPRGGPVFDAAGRLVGIVLHAKTGTDALLPVSRLTAQLGPMLGRPTPVPPVPRVSIDQIYESAMRVTLQVIAAN